MRTFFLLAVLVSLPLSVQADPLPVGSPAPQVKALDEKGNPVDFAKVYAKGTTLVYFYPKAGTPGCTAEACSLRDSYTQLQAKGLQIIGVSRDGVEEQGQFQASYKLPFTLVADPDGKVAGAFGVTRLMGIIPLDSRQSFLVKGGKIVWNSPHAATDGAAAEVKQALAHL